MALKKDPDHAFDINRLNMWFAITSILMFVSFVWMLWQDFHRDWKYYQARFRQLDRAKTEQAKTDEIESLRNNTEYQNVLAEMKTAEDTLAQHHADYQKAQDDQRAMQGRWYIADENYRFKKAEYESQRYDYEEAAATQSSDAARRKDELAKTKAEMDNLLATLDKVNGEKAGIDGRVAEFTTKIDDLEKQKIKLATKLDRLRRKETTIGPSFANVFRNLPLVDFIGPSIKIQQVVVNNQYEDLNFITVPRVDRCMTCHVAIDQDGYKEGTEITNYGKIEQPFVTHSRFDLFVGSNSKHPIDRFGCTGCHLGRGRSTSFEMATHTPMDKKQAEEWEKKYGWERVHDWDYPQYPVNMVEASCIKCHTGAAMIPGGDEINKSRMLFVQLGCHGCHLTKGFENLPKVGPDLRHISSKVTQDWAIKWIDNPRAFKPNTRMPRYFHNSNNSTPEDVERTNTEINGIVAYLFAKSEPAQFQFNSGVQGDPANGMKLVTEIGCTGCHLVGGEKPAAIDTYRHFGPPLDKIGSKTNPEWLFNWLKEPKNYAPMTRMPNLKLSDQEAADITAYLLSRHDQDWEGKPVPKVSEKWLHDEITYYLKRQVGLQAESEYGKMSQQQRLEFLGERAISRYGCSGCHLIKGFETAKGIGTSLSEEGSKRVTKFDFGFVNIDHTPPAYITQKLHDPRSFDVIPEKQKPLMRVKRWDEQLIMPNFGLEDDEIQHLVMLIEGLTKEKVPAEAQRVLTDREQVVEKGKWLIVQKNCVACHNIDGWGGEIRTLITEQGMAPPLLIGEGQKVQADWLFQFLKNPGRIRPWLKVRMPNFRLTDEEANTLVNYFMASGGTGTFDTQPDVHENMTEGQQLFTTFQCGNCHVVGAHVPEGKTAAELAPNLTMASTRLRPEWILKWLDDPQKYQPGTRMPDFFPEAALPGVLNQDPELQKAAIRNYLFSIGQGPQTSIETPEEFSGSPKPAVAQTPAAGGATGATK